MSNNKTKLFLLFTLIFIATIGISAATAADIDNDATDVPVVEETPTTDVVDDVTTDVDNKAQITKNVKTDVKTAGETEEKAKTSISFEPVENVKYLDNFTVEGSLVDEDGNGLNGQNITIKFNDEVTTLTTKSGIFKFNTTAKIAGENTITATYDGPKYAPSNTTYTFTVGKARAQIFLDDVDPVTKGNVTLISGILADSENPIPNQVIKILINDKAKKTLKTDKETGLFYFTYTTSRAGSNKLKATFEGNDYYEATTSEIEFQVARIPVSLNFDTIENVTKGRVTTISGNLTDENNKTLANKSVKFTINNSTKTVRTDSNGRFSFNYTFGKIGEINITGFYNGSETSYDQVETNLTLNVTKANVTLKMDYEENVPLNSNITITVTLNTTGGELVPNVGVKFTINNSTKTLKTDDKGVVTFVFKMTKQGLNTITVSSIANNMYLNATETIKVSVNKAE